MAKNEAKIKFTAETGSFNAEIKKANSEMSELRAELKLNETQMKGSGDAIEGLENKHRILSSQLSASEKKTEALSQKVEKAVQIFGENSEEASKLKTQLMNAQTAEEKLRQAVDQCANELDDQRAAASRAESASEQLTSTINRQQSELTALKNKYKDAVLQYGEASDEAKTLEKAIGDLSKELKDNQDKIADAADKADKFDKSLGNAGDSASNSSGGFTVMKGAIADLVSQAIQLGIEKIGEFVSYLAQLPEATMELRQDFATLTTSFDGMGFSTETATNTWKQLYQVFGEDDRAVEASNLIAKMSDDQKDLSDWVTITTGIWGSYQDSLPVEGLAEASMETARTGTVTGVLADALNWSSEAAVMFADYMGGDVVTAEDAFNKALSECTTEEERQALITDTLTALYGDAAETYRDTAGAQMEAKDAAADYALAEANMAAAIEPVTTAFTELKTTLLNQLAPAIEAVSGVATSALEWLNEHPVLVQAVGAALTVLSVGLGIAAVAWGIYTAAQWAANAAILANPMTWIIIAIIAAIAALVAIIVVVVNYWDEIMAAGQRAVEGIKSAWQSFTGWISSNIVEPIKNFFTGLWDGIKSKATSLWDTVKPVFLAFINWINTNIVQPVINFFTGLWDGVKNIWNNIGNAIQVALMFIQQLISGYIQFITLPWRFLWENCKEYVFAAWNWIKEKVTTALDAIKTVISNVWNKIKSVISTAVNAIKSVVTTVWNTIKTTTTTIFNAVKTVIQTVWNAVMTVVTNVLNKIKSAISTAWNAVKTTTQTAFNAVKTVVSTVWNGIKSTVSGVIDSVKSAISSAWDTIKTKTSNVFNSVLSVVTGIWNGIKGAITGAIDTARSTVETAINKIKSIMNFSWSLPKLKLPHVSITGKFSLDPPSVPKFSISWYKDGAIFTQPTLFATPYGMKGVGEAGAEAVLPIDKLEGYVANAVQKTMSIAGIDQFADAIEHLAERPVELSINGRKFAVATAGDADGVNGSRRILSNRGLALE